MSILRTFIRNTMKSDGIKGHQLKQMFKKLKLKVRVEITPPKKRKKLTVWNCTANRKLVKKQRSSLSNRTLVKIYAKRKEIRTARDTARESLFRKTTNLV